MKKWLRFLTKIWRQWGFNIQKRTFWDLLSSLLVFQCISGNMNIPVLLPCGFLHLKLQLEPLILYLDTLWKFSVRSVMREHRSSRIEQVLLQQCSEAITMLPAVVMTVPCIFTTLGKCSHTLITTKRLLSSVHRRFMPQTALPIDGKNTHLHKYIFTLIGWQILTVYLLRQNQVL